MSRESGLCVPGTAAYPASTAPAGLERSVWPGLLGQKVPCRLISSWAAEIWKLYSIFFVNSLQATKLS